MTMSSQMISPPPTFTDTPVSAVVPERDRNYRIWRLCAWSGVVYTVGAIIFFAITAGFIPPPSENWDAARVAAYFHQNHARITVGMEGVLLVAFFYAFFSIGLSRLMQRVEGPRGFLHAIEEMGGLATAGITIGCALAWLTAAFRAGTRAPGDVQTLNDLGWMIFNLTAPVTIAQMVGFGTVWLFRDERPQPLMPRWLGYLSIVTAAIFLVVFLSPWHTSGAFSWQGAITLYLGFGAFFVWIVAVLPLAFRAINCLEAEDRIAGSAWS
jgi:hypothetical protein